MRDRTGKELTNSEVVKKAANRGYNILLELELYLLHLVGYVPSHVIRRVFYTIAGIKIGRGSTIHMGAKFYDVHNITIGTDTIIGEGVTLDGRSKIKIGDHVDVATDVMIYNSEHDINSENFDPIFGDVIIEDYVFIGPRAIILPGVRVKKGAVVGAGAVVTRDVEENSVVGGVPAKEIGKRKQEALHYKLGRSRWFR